MSYEEMMQALRQWAHRPQINYPAMKVQALCEAVLRTICGQDQARREQMEADCRAAKVLADVAAQAVLSELETE